MQFRSFRLRIALLSAALAGSTLIGFGVTAWLQISDANAVVLMHSWKIAYF
ncbi:hypothetical protein [Scytonema sp. UIC 10036]|uniref:hypothetical protein n=1 Tax=Scytonema sp. UIC 10036 TaxID=2304196 RepID=UPI001FAA88B1|nr:hypothetical protein [Scytonema sp. UIC 10036]